MFRCAIKEAMYIESVANRSSPPAILLRESYREAGKVCKRTLANLSCLSDEVIEGLKVLLRGGVAVPKAADVFTVERSLPHGHVAAVLGSARGSGAMNWFASAPKELQPVLLAMLVARVISPASKLATHRLLHDDTAHSSLGRVLGVGQCSADDLYRALDWLHEAQPAIERRLARQHLAGSTLVLYDLTSTWLTGRCCELAARGHSRDGQRDDPQIVFGLICTGEGCPIAVEVFPGNTADPATVAAQVAKLLEVSSEHFPGERLVVCRNPLLAEERSRKRGELLAATEAELAKIAAATQRARSPLRGEQAIALRVGRVIEHFHMAKHFALTITETTLAYPRKRETIAAEAALDGLYVIRTSVPAQQLEAGAVVAAYKSLAHVERAFRSIKTVDLHVRPVFHYNAQRVRAHVFLCMLAYYVEWHMRRRLKPVLFDDEYLDELTASRPSPVTKAVRSTHAKAKDARKIAEDGLPVHSFRTLLQDLGTLTYNVTHTSLNPEAKIILTTRPTPLQTKAFTLLGLNPTCTQ